MDAGGAGIVGMGSGQGGDEFFFVTLHSYWKFMFVRVPFLAVTVIVYSTVRGRLKLAKGPGGFGVLVTPIYGETIGPGCWYAMGGTR